MRVHVHVHVEIIFHGGHVSRKVSGQRFPNSTRDKEGRLRGTGSQAARDEFVLSRD